MASKPPTNQFVQLMYLATANMKAVKQKEVKVLIPKRNPKPPDPKQVRLSVGVSKFLAMKTEDERLKNEDEHKKMDNLLHIRNRDRKSVTKVKKILNMTKSANKSCMDDANDCYNKRVAAQGESQPIQDDYGFTSDYADLMHEKMVQKYNSIPVRPAFPPQRGSQPVANRKGSGQKKASKTDGRSRAPSTDGRSKAGSKTDGRSKAASKTDGRSRAPSTDGRSRAPSTDGRSLASKTDRRGKAPSTDRRSRAPSTDGRSRAPSTDGRSKAASKTDGRSQAPSTDRRSRAPSTDGRSRAPSEDVRSRAPSTDGGTRAPSKERRRSKHKDDKGNRKGEPVNKQPPAPSKPGKPSKPSKGPSQPIPPPPNFYKLLEIATKKQRKPVPLIKASVEKKSAKEEFEFGRPMTAKEKAAYLAEKVLIDRVALRHGLKLDENNNASGTVKGQSFKIPKTKRKDEQEPPAKKPRVSSSNDGKPLHHHHHYHADSKPRQNKTSSTNTRSSKLVKVDKPQKRKDGDKPRKRDSRKASGRSRSDNRSSSDAHTQTNESFFYPRSKDRGHVDKIRKNVSRDKPQPSPSRQLHQKGLIDKKEISRKRMSSIPPRNSDGNQMKKVARPAGSVEFQCRKQPKSTLEIYESDEYDSEMEDFIDNTEMTDGSISALIGQMFNYDKRKYANEVSDDECMVSSVAEQLREEQRSLRIGIREDLEDIRREREEERRKMRKGKMVAHKKGKN